MATEANTLGAGQAARASQPSRGFPERRTACRAPAHTTQHPWRRTTETIWYIPIFSILLIIFAECDEGEDDGQWLSMPKLANKHLDVKLVGLRQLRVRVSNVQLALEDTFCHVLIGVPAVSRNDKNVEVCGAGKTYRKFKIDRTCIKPRREGNNQERLAQVETRVVVIGPDIKFVGTRIGPYGQTVLTWPHRYGESVVAVKFEEGAGSFFHESSLCMAKNEKILKDNKVFEQTTFPNYDYFQ